MVDERRLYQALGERLKALRESQQSTRGKVTQAKLAEEVGLERTSITNIERGNQKVPLHVLYRICEALQVPISEVLPPLAEVKSTAAEPALEELTFAGRTEKVPPLLMQKLAQFIDTGDRHDERKS
jgi:transcriptional regulator with XRE-family HTH domain